MNTYVWIVATLIALAYLLYDEFFEIIRNHFVLTTRPTRHHCVESAASDSVTESHIYIAMMSARRERRRVIRRTWMRRMNTSRVRVRFFVDRGVVDAGSHDTIELPTRSKCNAGCRNTMEPNLFMMRYALAHAHTRYFVRMDDDAYLCPQNLLRFIDTVLAPQPDKYANVFIGNFYTTWGLARADENFQVYSRSFARFIVDGFTSGLLPHSPDVTFARNVAYWVALTQVRAVDSHRLFVNNNNNRNASVRQNPPCNKNVCAEHIVVHAIKSDDRFVCVDILSTNETLASNHLRSSIEKIGVNGAVMFRRTHDFVMKTLPIIQRNIDELEPS